jgi:hypothetical protein
MDSAIGHTSKTIAPQASRDAGPAISAAKPGTRRTPQPRTAPIYRAIAWGKPMDLFKPLEFSNLLELSDPLEFLNLLELFNPLEFSDPLELAIFSAPFSLVFYFILSDNGSIRKTEVSDHIHRIFR